MLKAIGLVELISVAKGIEAADAMLKSASIELLEAKPACPGKYIVLISGEVASVQNAIEAGQKVGSTAVVDDFILPNIHPCVINAIAGISPATEIKALGIIETFSVASLIVAADSALKAGDVEIIEIRIAMGLGGKSFVTFTGDISSVISSVDAGVASVSEKGMLAEKAIIPAPHNTLKQYV